MPLWSNRWHASRKLNLKDSIEESVLARKISLVDTREVKFISITFVGPTSDVLISEA